MEFKNRKKLYNVGINDADYYVEIRGKTNNNHRSLIWRCPFYSKWKSMLVRCYSEKYQEKTPTYAGCSVCNEWHLFSNFKIWMQQQDWEGKVLDKDILFPDNKIYKPETCMFVTNAVNLFITGSDATRGEYPIGVSLNKKTGLYSASCSTLSRGKSVYLGSFSTPSEAHMAWKREKLKQAILLASKETDLRISEALIKRYSF